MVEDWRCMRDEGQLIGIVSKAFDVIQHPILLAKLKAYEFEEDSCTLLRHYLSQRVKIGDNRGSR